MKTTKGGKVMNPTDAYRKELRKKELKRNKKERKKVREVGILKKDPEAIKDQIEKLEMMKADGALDKARKHKKRQLEDTLNLVLKKRKEYEEKMREKGETPVMFSHLGPLRRRTNAEEDERANHPKPEDSVYYHPTLNPTGAPPPGKPPMYKSSIGPRIPLPASSSAGASTSMSESEETALAVPPPPMADSAKLPSGDDSDVPSSIPLPPPPPLPTKPAVSGGSLPPPPPGPPPKGSTAANGTLRLPPPPPSIQRPLQPPPPGTSGEGSSKVVASEGINMKEVKTVLPPPPPPPGLPQKLQPDATSVSNAGNPIMKSDTSKAIPMMPPPPPPLAQGIPYPNLQPDMMPPGMTRFPPPPPDVRPPLPVPGLHNRPPPPPPPPGMAAPLMPRPPFAAPPGPPPLPMPPFQLSHLAFQEDDLAALRPPVPQKPSYVKSAASTVVKRPLAQHTPELTAMVPASVRVRRETAAPKAKPKSLLSGAHTSSRPTPTSSASKPEKTSTSAAAPKVQSIDDSYMAFLEDMKALGALDS